MQIYSEWCRDCSPPLELPLALPANYPPFRCLRKEEFRSPWNGVEYPEHDACFGMDRTAHVFDKITRKPEQFLGADRFTLKNKQKRTIIFRYEDFPHFLKKKKKRRNL